MRARSERYAAFGSVQAAEERLTDLMERDQPLVERMSKEPGQKENRYRCLLVADAPRVAELSVPADLEERVAALEETLQQVLLRLEAQGG